MMWRILIRRASVASGTGSGVRCGCSVTALFAYGVPRLAFHELPRCQFSLPPSRRGTSHLHCLAYTPRSAACCCNAAFPGIAQIRGDKFLLFLAIRAGHHRGNRRLTFIEHDHRSPSLPAFCFPASRRDDANCNRLPASDRLTVLLSG